MSLNLTNNTRRSNPTNDEATTARSGPKPDPVGSANDPEMLKHLYVLEQFQAEKVGWGKRPLRGPSSKWVDTHRYPIWTGEGARTDVLRACENAERSEHAKVCQCSEPLSSLLTQDL
ncbi:hypothetical protein FVEG_16471 [Fusarium verticillioides 7600]|uniref:Uncharacterized protein n=1 Tax=Gibberella moniliformis (strain M3125 / FGSC 7600) TaxID=334819 RepID=W7MY54_GIBM7|nr:hypothetical protein FVEG_16471 [Fusarium verticillioides 7600]EWG49307.1 hypothetical protein FVEG_16471 [Fusarium verticillioides 7600]